VLLLHRLGLSALALREMACRFELNTADEDSAAMHAAALAAYLRAAHTSELNMAHYSAAVQHEQAQLDTAVPSTTTAAAAAAAVSPQRCTVPDSMLGEQSMSAHMMTS
jgi:hypothetical protein